MINTLQELFSKQKRYLEDFYSKLDMKSYSIFVEMLLKCDGIIFFTGVGKSGFVAQKIAATMISTGTRSLFLSPTDALHGDIGVVTKNDLVVFLSKSGETDELLELLPFVRNRGAKICAIVCNAHSRLAKGADFSVLLPCAGELCPFDLAPTLSTEEQLLFGDVCAMAIMQLRGFSLDHYAENHPAGRIGKRASLKVKDLMLGEESAPFCAADQSLKDVLIDFTNKRCGCLIVIDENKELKGIFTDGDLRRALQLKGEGVLEEKVGNLMTSCPRSISKEAMAWDALRVMEGDQKNPITILPVLDKNGDRVIGVIKMHDLIQAGI